MLTRSKLTQLATTAIVNRIARDVVSYFPGMVGTSKPSTKMIGTYFGDITAFKPGTSLSLAVDRLLDLIDDETLETFETPEDAISALDSLPEEDPAALTVVEIEQKLVQLVSSALHTVDEMIAPTLENLMTRIERRVNLEGEHDPIASVEIQVVNWGDLSDPRRMQTPLMICREHVNMYTQSQTIQPFFTPTCMSHAQMVTTADVPHERIDATSDVIRKALSQYEGTEHASTIDMAVKLMTRAYAYRGLASVTEGVLSDASKASESARSFTSLMRMISTLESANLDLGDTDLDAVHSNLEAVRRGVSFMMGSLYAARELDFKNTLIYAINGNVVSVGAEALSVFEKTGHGKADIARWALYTRMKNITTPVSGWAMETITDRADVTAAVESFVELEMSNAEGREIQTVRSAVERTLDKWTSGIPSNRFASSEQRAALCQEAATRSTVGARDVRGAVAALVNHSVKNPVSDLFTRSMEHAGVPMSSIGQLDAASSVRAITRMVADTLKPFMAEAYVG